MKYDLSNDIEKTLFKNQCEWLLENEKTCKLEKLSKNRTITQNASLHLYFEIISDKLNDMGYSFTYQGLQIDTLETTYTPKIVKEFIVKPIMSTLWDIESTTKLDTEKINIIIDIINKFFSDRGEYVPFPSIQSLMEYMR